MALTYLFACPTPPTHLTLQKSGQQHTCLNASPNFLNCPAPSAPPFTLPKIAQQHAHFIISYDLLACPAPSAPPSPCHKLLSSIHINYITKLASLPCPTRHPYSPAKDNTQQHIHILPLPISRLVITIPVIFYEPFFPISAHYILSTFAVTSKSGEGDVVLPIFVNGFIILGLILGLAHIYVPVPTCLAPASDIKKTISMKQT
jgi:hypothetical protein